MRPIHIPHHDREQQLSATPLTAFESSGLNTQRLHQLPAYWPVDEKSVRFVHPPLPSNGARR